MPIIVFPSAHINLKVRIPPVNVVIAGLIIVLSSIHARTLLGTKTMAFLWLFVAFGYLLLYAFASLQTFDTQDMYLKRIAN
ncbi:hypothetical protein AFLA_005588 [Aspergillus flavus NRRL3357]|nr:hypothetical protein AFLA_005588 [Aspergillus flavus NRRL3357]